MARILIIDDDAQLREMLRRVLENEGFEVSEAADGNEGIASCQVQPPDIVLTDIVMPEKEGIATIVELRQSHADLPIIAMSGGMRYGSREYLQAALRLGANGTLEKPFRPQQVIEAIRSRLSPVDG